MRNLMIVVIGLLFVSGLVMAADQPTNIGYVQSDGPLGLYQRTVAQINSLQPYTTGQLIYCSDCAYSIVCVSTGSHPTNSVGAYVSLSSAAVTNTHCR